MTIAQQAPTKAPPTYFGLAFVSVLLRVLGWVQVAGAIVLVAVSLAGYSPVAAGGTGRTVQQQQFGPISFSGSMPAPSADHRTGMPQWSAAAAGAAFGIGLLVWGLFIVGAGEAFEALRDVARNSFRWHG